MLTMIIIFGRWVVFERSLGYDDVKERKSLHCNVNIILKKQNKTEIVEKEKADRSKAVESI